MTVVDPDVFFGRLALGLQAPWQREWRAGLSGMGDRGRPDVFLATRRGAETGMWACIAAGPADDRRPDRCGTTRHLAAFYLGDNELTDDDLELP